MAHQSLSQKTHYLNRKQPYDKELLFKTFKQTHIMKKLLLLAAISFATIGTTISCSSRDDEPTTQPEKQDFTNANFIKLTLKGDWLRTQWSYDGATWNTGGTSTYNFTETSYSYKDNLIPNSIFDEAGTYIITPVMNDNNAQLTLNYTYDNTPKTRKLNLIDYKDGVVTTSHINIGSPTGTYYEKYKKQ